MKMRMIKPLKVCLAGTFASAFLLTISSFSQSTPDLTDPEVAHAAVTANQIDISYAEIALKKSKTKDVRDFAETMSRDHKSVIAQATALAKKLGVTPKDNAVSKQLLSDAEKTKKMLNGKTGKDFDKSYIDNEVSYHKAVISTVESVLIPTTENAELKKFLQDVVPALKAHLEHAEMIQKMYAGK